MNKSEQKQVDRALAHMQQDARYAAVSLATLQRSAVSARSRHEISGVIKANPVVERHLQLVNGCYVERQA